MDADKDEIILSSTRGVHRFDAKTNAWKYLDPGCSLRNSEFDSAVAVGEELWVGYSKRSFGVWGAQGISRFNERTGAWRYMSPVELGTASPVTRMVALPNQEIWVLFATRPWLGSAFPWNFYPREGIKRQRGLGRWADGKWSFRADTLPPERHELPFGMRCDLVALGNRLVYQTKSGVYVGPEPWNRVVEGEVYSMAPTEDGKTVKIRRLKRAESGVPSLEQQVGYLGSDEKQVQFKPIPRSSPDWVESPFFHNSNSLSSGVPSVGYHEARIPVRPGHFVVVENLCTGGYAHGLLQSPTAVWVFSQGEIVRLDRKVLAELAQEMLDKN